MPDATGTCCICNTSPLFYLHCVDKLALLERIYHRVTITPDVAEELHQGFVVGENVPAVASLPWIALQQVTVPDYICLIPDLGRDEASVLTLGIEHKQQALLVLDDKLGRRIAKAHGLRVTGTGGILLKAKQLGLLKALEPVLNDLARAGFYLHDRVRQDLLELAGEQ